MNSSIIETDIPSTDPSSDPSIPGDPALAGKKLTLKEKLALMKSSKAER
jgi:hypothetical protein